MKGMHRGQILNVGQIAVCKIEITQIDNRNNITLFAEQLTRTFEVLVLKKTLQCNVRVPTERKGKSSPDMNVEWDVQDLLILLRPG